MKTMLTPISPITRFEFRFPIMPRPVPDTLVYSEIHQIVGRVIDTRIADGREVTVIENAGGFRIDCSPLRLRPATSQEFSVFAEEAADRKSMTSRQPDHALTA